MTVNNTTSPEIDITRYSSYTKLIRVTARVLAVGQRNLRPSLKNAAKTLTPADIGRAEIFWIRKAQESLKEQVIEGKFKRLCPRTREDGIIVIGSHAAKWMQMSYNQHEVILLAHDHRFSRLYTERIHFGASNGMLRSSKFSQRKTNWTKPNLTGRWILPVPQQSVCWVDRHQEYQAVPSERLTT